jgi:hypothetical protein
VLLLLFITFFNYTPVVPKRTINQPVKNTYVVKTVTLYEKCGHTITTEKEQSEKPQENVITINENKYCPHHYLVKSLNGKLAVFSLNNVNTDPLRIILSDTVTLPEGDKQLLNTGIEVHSDEALSQLIEDYTS